MCLEETPPQPNIGLPYYLTVTELIENISDAFYISLHNKNLTAFYQTFAMWRVFDTLDRKGFIDPTLRSLRSLSMGLLRFNLFEVIEKSV